ncbi:uncharacterized protein LOC117817520 [Notolabrus celidotus]|uniref:uncharacterized protein LOC117817520 n=1 Tax=Notolabrus celidotus TaxID=1203425 RepID=UPI0014900697|nr:uncharacterized protein LOC117817520 [Notolabrus celidotus]
MQRRVLLFFSLLCVGSVFGQVSYSIPEEMPKGSLVGNMAKDFGLDVKRLKSGKARIFTRDSDGYIELNNERGVLLIKERIDREALCGQTTPCALHFQIILENPMEFYSVTVEITDVNDNPPTFDKTDVKFKISESAVSGAKFILDRAVDPDVGLNGLQTYKLEPTDNFVVKLHDQADGTKNVEMVLEKPLDREKNERLSLILTAVDGGEPQMSGTMQILITVLDANDNAPVFTQPIYKASIKENSPVGTAVVTVTATDKDKGSNGKITYSVSSILDHARGLFEVNDENGEIRLKGHVDYEKARSFQINIRASDDGGLVDACKVIIDVIDINDNKPDIIIMSKSNIISEDAKPGTVVTMINIEDADSGENGKVECFINENIPFVMKSTSNSFYSLVTDSDLDREIASQYNITVTCSDEGVPSLSSSVTLTLQISDVNDNAPVFERSSYEAYIVENNTPGLSVFTVKATDADWNQNARVSYILEDSSVNGVPVSSYVSVSADSGVIHAVRSLDYEQIKYFQFRVKAQDGGSPPLSSNVTVKMVIQDQNDNPPQVLYPVQTGGSVVAEMVPRAADVGYLVTKVVAVDVDSGQNAWLSYKLQKATDRALFEVGLQNGEIRTIRQVSDKDAVKQRLTVIVEDNGQPSRSATVIVNVAVADSFPEVLSEFTDFTHDKEYNDNLTFYLVLALAVVSFLFITCLVVIISVKIYRWRQSRVMYHSNLPVIPYYPPRYSDTMGTGTLPHVYNYEVCRTTDSRKSDCKFGIAGSQNVLIMDPSSTGTMQRIQSEKSILDEPDSPLEVRIFGRNRDPQMNGMSASAYFSVNAESGEILAVRSFDYEQIKEVHIRVKAQDGGSPPLSSNVTVKIVIQDQNDNPPQVLYPVQTGGSVVAEMVPRAADVGYLVTKVVAVDVDSGQNAWLSYKLQKATDRALFEVGLQNGEIRTIRQVSDKDAVKQRLTVIVEDNGQPSRSATVIVNVAVADSFPEVLSEFTDFTHDKEYNDNLTFYLVLALAVVSFLFITCLVVIISVKIYRWRHERVFYKSSGNLPVIPYYPPLYADVGGTDMGFMERGIMRNKLAAWQVFLWWLHFFLLWITIDGQTRYSIPEELKQGSVVGNLAKDLGLVVSELYRRKLRITSEAGKQYFSIDLGKGELVVIDRIDREELCGQRPSCVLPLELVIDNPLQLHRVEIEIQDTNDNSPSFLTKEKVLSIAELVNPGARFPLESAQDPDVGVNSVRSYLISKNDNFKLTIKNHKDGRKIPELVLEKPLDREKLPVHNLILTAVDGGDPARSGTSEITVVVLDNNDNAPQFDRQLYEANVSEEATPGTEILHVKATDADEGLNGEIEYFFAEQTTDLILSLFDIVPATGAIVIKRHLDHETNSLHRFDITAKDKGNPKMDGHCGVEIKVVDINDNIPEIIVTSLTTPVPEDSAIGTVIALISAKDPDSGDNGKVTLSLSSKSPFSLNPSVSNHYSLVTNGPLDREKNDQYSVKISVIDSGKPPLSSEKLILVKLLDVNDNPPVFSQPNYVVYVKENHSPGKILCSVSASDPDLGENAKISYSILDSKVQDVSVSSYVYINSDNGSIYSMHSFDYEKLKVFQIQVQAKDQGSPSLSSNATVHVFILDQNDNAPAVIYPSSAAMGSLSHQRMPRSAKAGHLVTKVTAVDADSGHNAWISYKVAKATDASLFTVNLYTGEVRTKRAVYEHDDSSQRLLIEIKDDGEPVQSTTVTVSILMEDGLHEPILDLRHKVSEPSKKNGRITLYLILSLASVSVLSVVTFLILTVKCIRNSRSSASCCTSRSDCDDYKNPNRNLQIQLNTDGPIKYVEVLGGDMLSQSQSFRSCMSPMSEYSDFTLIKPSSTTDFKEVISVLDASLPDSTWTFESQQVSRQ